MKLLVAEWKDETEFEMLHPEEDERGALSKLCEIMLKRGCSVSRTQYGAEIRVPKETHP